LVNNYIQKSKKQIIFGYAIIPIRSDLTYSFNSNLTPL